MLTHLVHYFYPELTREEIKKFGLLALTFFFIVGAYWALRLLKDVIFLKYAFPADLGWVPNQGYLFLPQVKSWSARPTPMLLLVLLYIKLVDWCRKQTLFYIIGTCYALILACITAMLFIQAYFGNAYLGKDLLAWLGWISYIAIDYLGIFLMAACWSFTNAVSTNEEAKRGYALLLAGICVGTLTGMSLNYFSVSLGVWGISLIATLAIIAAIYIISLFMRIIPELQRVGNPAAHATENEREGFFWGLFTGFKLLFTRGYLVGLLVLSSFYSVISKILDYQLKSFAANDIYYGTVAHMQKLLSMYGMVTNISILLLALFGINYTIKRFGTSFVLLICPIALVIALLSNYTFYSIFPESSASFWAVFGVLSIKSISYAISNLAKEIMYIPTSKDTKFKGRIIIDILGQGIVTQVANMVGYFTPVMGPALTNLMKYGTFFCIGMLCIWLVAALYVGRKNDKLTSEDTIIE
ncbi:MAG: hypothetical protein M1114_01650 [Candidatus Dependentiae bacterium]|nr:hypothetical protein [Candidatus Dependentiae bacterium]